ncbi:lasso peptide biosynthesis B2 protein [Lentzea tibetensis]|nr:lasso peptide biosynthesis B2 protein [Lentzea tibetensis]
MIRYLTAPAHVVACDLGPATVVVNYRSGGVHTLIGPSARWWAEVATTGDLSRSNGLDSRPMMEVCERLRQAEVLIEAATPTPWTAPVAGQPWTLSFGTQEAQAGWAVPSRAPRGAFLIAGFALVLTLVALRVGQRRTRMARILRLLSWVSKRPAQLATVDHADEVLNAVRWVALFVPSRVACLEESVAAVLALSFSGRQATWCHGVAADPIRFHCWVDVNGQPVAEPSSTLRYTPLKTVPERT